MTEPLFAGRLLASRDASLSICQSKAGSPLSVGKTRIERPSQLAWGPGLATIGEVRKVARSSACCT